MRMQVSSSCTGRLPGVVRILATTHRQTNPSPQLPVPPIPGAAIRGVLMWAASGMGLATWDGFSVTSSSVRTGSAVRALDGKLWELEPTTEKAVCLTLRGAQFADSQSC